MGLESGEGTARERVGGCPQPQSEEFLDLGVRIQERRRRNKGSEPSVVAHTSNPSAWEVETKQLGSSLTTHRVGVDLDHV